MKLIIFYLYIYIFFIHSFFYFLGWEASSKASNSFWIRLIASTRLLLLFSSFYFYFGRRAQRRPIGLITSTLIFSIFLLFFYSFAFAHTMNTHIHWYSFIPMNIQIFLYLKFSFPYLKGTVQFQKLIFDTIQVFILSSSQNIPS